MTYKFDNTLQKWVVKEQKEPNVEEESDDSDTESKDSVVKQDMTKGTYGYEGDTHTYTDATDGTVYIWDREKNAWFPKVGILSVNFPFGTFIASQKLTNTPITFIWIIYIVNSFTYRNHVVTEDTKTLIYKQRRVLQKDCRYT